MTLRSFAPSLFGAVTIAAAASASTALALPLGVPSEMARSAPEAAFSQMLTSGVDFSGTVALNNCSGSLIRFATSKGSDRGLILTNGHCYEGGFPTPGQVIVDTPSSRSFQLLNADASDTLATLTADKVLYSTMTDTDVTLYRLTQSYDEISTQTGIQALTVTQQHPAAGMPIRIVSGFWRTIYSCSVDNFVYELHEGDWIFKDALRYSASGCEVIGGTSGSPVIEANTHEVVAINNTINESGESCTDNNPCEVDKAGTVVIKKGVGYAEEIFRLNGCLTATNEIDLSIAGCTLPKPQQF